MHARTHTHTQTQTQTHTNANNNALICCTLLSLWHTCPKYLISLCCYWNMAVHHICVILSPDRSSASALTTVSVTTPSTTSGPPFHPCLVCITPWTSSAALTSAPATWCAQRWVQVWVLFLLDSSPSWWSLGIHTHRDHTEVPLPCPCGPTVRELTDLFLCFTEAMMGD